MPSGSKRGPEGYIGTSEAGERLGYSPATIRTWAKRGEITHVRRGGKQNAGYIWVLESEVEERERKTYSREEEIIKHYTERVLEGLEAHHEALTENQRTGFEMFDRLIQGQERVTERLDNITERLNDTARYQERVSNWLERLDPARIRIDPPSEAGGGSGGGPISVSLP